MKISEASNFLTELKQDGVVYLPANLAITLIQEEKFNGMRVLGAECLEAVNGGWRPSMEFILSLTRLSSPHYTREESVKELLTFLEDAVKKAGTELCVCIVAKV